LSFRYFKNNHTIFQSRYAFLKGISGTTFIILAGKGFSYLFQLTLTYKFGALVAGIFTIWFTSINILSFLSRWGLDVLAVQLIPKYKSSLNKQWFIVNSIATLSLKITSGLIIIWLIVSPWVATNFFHNPSLVIPFKYSAILLIPFNFLFLSAGIHRGFNSYYSFAFIQHFLLHFFSFTFLIIGIRVLFSETSFLSPINAFAAGIVLTAIIGVGLLFHQFPRGVSIQPTNDNLFKSGIPFALSNIAFFLLNWMDVLLVAYFLTEVDVGIFNLIMRVALIVSLPILGINSVLGPRISDAFFSKSTQRLKKLFFFSCFTGTLTSLPIYIGLWISHPLILNYFGSEFNSAATPFLILAAAQFFHSATGSAGLSLQMMNHAKDFQNILFIVVIIKLVCGTFLISEYGLYGATLNVLIAVIIWKTATCITLINRYKSFCKKVEVSENG